jgi:lipopolysaccharide/colanic/teichoic acid biosynthesis glycosyltransferase
MRNLVRLREHAGLGHDLAETTRRFPVRRLGSNGADQAPVLTEIKGRHHTRERRQLPASKRCFDASAAFLLLLLLAPGLLAIALAIKLTSPGPVLFRQWRYGLNNQLFRIYKYRTMYADQGDEAGVRQTRRGDQRVTSLGRFLRRSSLDEVPQLPNVLKGDMSLVGPRPHVPEMLAGGVPYEKLVPYYFERHRVRPGITGLAQANGLRGSTEDPGAAIARIKRDLEYIDTWSLRLDLRLLIETVRTELLQLGSGM